MRTSFRFAIILTLSLFGFSEGARAIEDERLGDQFNETEASCRVPEQGIRDIDWVSALKKSIERSQSQQKKPEQEPDAPPPVAEEAVTTGEEVAEESAPEEEAVPGKYDLPKALLKKLSIAQHREAGLCRYVKARKKRKAGTYCGEDISKGWCYRAVKNALAAAGLVKSWWSDAHAKNAHKKGMLEARGFKNVMGEGYTAETAPLGSLIVYAGGANGYGHIEARIGEYEYCSDFCRGGAMNQNSRTYKILGIYVKKSAVAGGAGE